MLAAVLGAVLVVSVVPLAPDPASATAGPPARPQRPSVSCAAPYAVVRGDSWYAVARRHGVTLDALLAANGATASTTLFAGSTICLPDGATPTTPAPPTTVPAAPPTTVPAAPPASGGLAAFPVQGPCTFTDTWGAPRGGGRVHEGVDLIAPVGRYVYAVQPGTLTRQNHDRPGSLSGNAWWLTAADGTYYFYAHLSAFAPDLRVGSKVQAGQIIGFVGRTGNAGVAHLHFEVHPRGGAAVNPTPIVRAVNGCSTSAPPAQPNGAPAPEPAPPAPAPPAPAPAPPAPPAPAPPVVAPVANPANPGTGGTWQFFAPRAAFDAALKPGVPQRIRVNQLGGVPPGTTGVMLRLAATGPAAAGYLVTHPCDAPPPATTSLSFRAGTAAVGTAMAPVGGGFVCVTSNTTVRVKVEVLAAQASTGVGLQAVAATRVLDTRTTARLGPGTSVKLTPAQLGATASTQALSVTVTIVGPAAAGTLSMGFCGQGPWIAPVSTDPVSSFAMTMRTSSAGWCLTSSVALDVIVDVVGIWTGTGSPGPVAPVRVLDTRGAGGPIDIGGRQVAVAGVAGLPAGATTAVLAVTAVTGAAGSTVFVVPCGTGRPSGSALAASPGRVTTAVVPVQLAGGAVCISAINAVEVIVDVLGTG